MKWLIANIEFIGALASIVGIVLGIPGLIIGLFQLRRTKKAAEAAEAAANDALQRLSNAVAVASIEQICSRSRDLLHLTRARDLSGSALVAFELRDSLAKFTKSKGAIELQGVDAWRDLLERVSEIHDALEAAAAIRKIDAGNREGLLQSIARIHSQLSMLAVAASERAGGIDAYPK